MTTNTYTKLQALITASPDGLRFQKNSFSGESVSLFDNEFIGGLYLLSPTLVGKSSDETFKLTGTSSGNPFILDGLAVTVEITNASGLINSASAEIPASSTILFNNVLKIKNVSYAITYTHSTYTLDYTVNLDITSELGNLVNLLKNVPGGNPLNNFKLTASIKAPVAPAKIPNIIYAPSSGGMNFPALGHYQVKDVEFKLLTQVSWAYDHPSTKTGRHPISTNAIQLSGDAVMEQIQNKSMALSTQFVLNTEILSFFVDIESPAGQSAVLTFNDLLSLVPGANLHQVLPTNLPFIDSFGLQSLLMTINISGTPSISGFYVSLATDASFNWDIIPNILSLTKVEIDFGVILSGDQTAIDASILGDFKLDNQYPFKVSGTYPQYVFRAFSAWKKTDAPTISDLLGGKLGNSGAIKNPLANSSGGSTDPTIESVTLTADAKNKTYSANLLIDPDISLSFSGDDPWFVVTELGFNINYLKSNFSGDLYGNVGIGTSPQIDLSLYASYDKSSTTWKFKGSLQKQVTFTLSHLLSSLFSGSGSGYVPPTWLSDVSLTIKSMSLDYSKTASATSYHFSLDAEWDIEIPNLNKQATLEAIIYVSKNAGGTKPVGSIKAIADFYGCSLSVGVDFTATDKTYTLAANIDDDLIVNGTYDSTTKTASLTFDKIPSVGQVLTFLIKTAEPGMDLILPDPWDILNDIKIPGEVTLDYDFQTKAISIEFDSDVDLVLVKLSAIKATYIPQTATKAKQVMISVTGSLITGENFSPGWNALQPQSAPKVPGKAAPFELKYLGVGQHISPTNLASMNTVTEAISGLAGAFNQSGTAKKGEPISGTGLKYDAKAGWLIGADFSILDVFDMGFIFLDPLLYGLVIGVKAKPSAKPFGGLHFEIMYKKVNDTTGMYYIYLTLPTIMRHLEFGEVSVTLPSLKLWVYTDGSFKIDLGFPYHDSWKDSFGLEIFPFIGEGGFYFGELKRADVKFLPNTYGNGVFNPVIELGLALRVGLGKNIHEGILSAGVSLTVAGTLQGMMTFYHPKNGGEKSIYFTIAAMLAIIGKVYGSISFAIISARFNVKASISVRTTFMEYEPILLNFKAYVSVELTVSIHLVFFTIHIHFGFSTTLTESFTIGHATTPPWGTGPETLPPPGIQMLATAMLEGTPAALHTIPSLTQNSFNISTAITGAEQINLLFSPHYTTSGGEGQAIIMTYIDSYKSGDDKATAQNSFANFGTGLVRWLSTTVLVADGITTVAEINTGGGTSFLDEQVVTIDQLNQLALYFADNRNQPLAWSQAKDFLEAFFSIEIELPKNVTSKYPSDYNATVFPMMPSLEVTVPSITDVYGTYTSINENVTFSSQPELVTIVYKNELHIFAQGIEHIQKYKLYLYNFCLKNGVWSFKKLAQITGNNSSSRGAAFVHQEKLYYLFFKNCNPNQNQTNNITEYQYDGDEWSSAEHPLSKMIFPGSSGNLPNINVTSYNSDLQIIFDAGNSDPLWYVTNRSDNTWSIESILNCCPLGGHLNSVVQNGNLYTFYVVANNNQNINGIVYDGQSWSDFGISIQPFNGPAVVSCCPIVLNDNIYLFTSGYNQPSIQVLKYDGENWKQIDLHKKLPDAPQAANTRFYAIAHQEKIHFSYISTGKEIIDITFDGTNWDYCNISTLCPNAPNPHVYTDISPVVYESQIHLIYNCKQTNSPLIDLWYSGSEWKFKTLKLTIKKEIKFNNTSNETAYDSTQLTELNEYLQSLKVNNETAADQETHAPVFQGNPASTTEIIFVDFIAMMAKQVVQDSTTLFKEYDVETSDVNTFTSFIDKFGLNSTDYPKIINDNRNKTLNTAGSFQLATATHMLKASDITGHVNTDLTNIISANFYGTLTAQDILDANPGIHKEKTSGADEVVLVAGEIIDIPPFVQALTGGPTSVTTLLDVANYYHIHLPDVIDVQLRKISGNDWSQPMSATNQKTVMNGLFTTGSSNLLRLCNLQQMSVGNVVSKLKANSSFAHLSGMTARFMMHGLQLPTPDDVQKAVLHEDTDGLVGLYKLTQQQIGVSQIVKDDKMTVSMSAEPNYKLDMLTIPHPDYSFGANDVTAINAMTASFESLMSFPSTMPVEMFMVKEKNFTLHNKINLTTPAPFSTAVGPASLWKLNPHLLQVLQHQPTTPYNFQLFSKRQLTKSNVEDDVLQTFFMPSTLLKFQVRRVQVAHETGQFLPNIYEVHSVDTESVRLLTQIEEAGANATTKQFRIMYPDTPIRNGYETPKQLIDGGPSNATSNAPDLFFIQSNLSEIADPVPNATIPLTTAEIDAQTTRYLLEAGVVHTGGYYMYYKNPHTQKELPEHLFSSKQPDTEITLLISYQYTAGSDFNCVIAPFHNYIAYQGQINLDSENIFLETKLTAQAPFDPAVQHKAATAPPGSAGFDFSKPAAEWSNTIDKIIENLFHLVSYNLVENSDFNASQASQPMGPLKQNQVLNTYNNQPLSSPADSTEWHYEAMSSVYPWLKTKPADTDPNMPTNSESPYIAIGKKVQFELNWVDLFGNTLLSTPYQTPKITLGYTDAIVQLSEWPHLMSSYQILTDDPTSKKIHVQANFAINYGPFTPESSRKTHQVQTTELITPQWVKKAQNSLEKYKHIYYQYTAATVDSDPDIVIQMGSTISFPKQLGEPFGSSVNSVPIQSFINLIKSCYLYFKGIATSQLKILPYQIPANERQSVSDITTAHSISTTAELQAFNLANEGLPYELLVGSSINVPSYTPHGGEITGLKNLKIFKYTTGSAVTIADFTTTWLMDIVFFEVLNPDLAGKSGTHSIPLGTTLYCPVYTYIVRQDDLTLTTLATTLGIAVSLLEITNPSWTSGNILLNTALIIPVPNAKITEAVIPVPATAPFCFFTPTTEITDFSTYSGISASIIETLNPTLASGNTIPTGTKIILPTTNRVLKDITGYTQALLQKLNPDLTFPLTKSTTVVVPDTPWNQFSPFTSATKISDFSTFSGISASIIQSLNPLLASGNSIPANTTITVPTTNKVLKNITGYTQAFLKALNPGITFPLTTSTNIVVPNTTSGDIVSTKTIIDTTWQSLVSVLDGFGTSLEMYQLFNPSPSGSTCKIPGATIVNIPVIPADGNSTTPAVIGDFTSITPVTCAATMRTEEFAAWFSIDKDLFIKYNPTSTLLVQAESTVFIPCGTYTVLTDGVSISDLVNTIAYTGSVTQITKWLKLMNPSVTTFNKGDLSKIPVPQPISIETAETLNTTDNGSIFELQVKIQASRKSGTTIEADAPDDVSYHNNYINPDYNTDQQSGAVAAAPPLTLRNFAQEIEVAMPGFKVATTEAKETDPDTRFKEIWLVNLPTASETPMDTDSLIDYSYSGYTLTDAFYNEIIDNNDPISTQEQKKQLDKCRNTVCWVSYASSADVISAAQAVFTGNWTSGGKYKDKVSECVQQGNASYYAIPPLSNYLVSSQAEKGIPIYTYTTGTYLGNTFKAPPSLYKKFKNIEMESLMQDFLLSIDNFLFPEYAVPAFQLETKQDATHQPYSNILHLKDRFAKAISCSMQSVLDQGEGMNTAPPSVIAEVQKEMLIRLSNAYSFDAVGQLPLTVAVDLAQEVKLSLKTPLDTTANIITKSSVTNPNTFPKVIAGAAVSTTVNGSNAFPDKTKVTSVTETTITLSHQPTRKIPVGTNINFMESIYPNAYLHGQAEGAILNDRLPSGEKIKFPIFSISPSNIKLSNGATSSDLVFLFSTKQDKLQRVFPITFDFKMNKIEHNIKEVTIKNSTVPVGEWLSFVLPFEETKDINLNIPIPLRDFPQSPALPQQKYLPYETQFGSAPVTPFTDESPVPSFSPTPTALEKAKAWRYEFGYKYKQASQDTLNIGITTTPASNGTQYVAPALGYDLVDALLQFQAIHPSLKADLDKFLVEKRDTSEGKIDTLTAVRSFAFLVARVFKAYKEWPTDKVNYEVDVTADEKFDINTVDGLPDEYQLQVAVRQGQATTLTPPIVILNGYIAKHTSPEMDIRKINFVELIQDINLQLNSVLHTSDNTIYESDVSSGELASIEIGDTVSATVNGSNVFVDNTTVIAPTTGTKITLSSGPTSKIPEGTNIYFIKEGPQLSASEGQQIFERVVRFDEGLFDILSKASAKGNISITRNEELISGHTTNPAFLYQSPLVAFVNPVHPILAPDPHALQLFLTENGEPPTAQNNKLDNLLANFLMGLNGGAELTQHIQINCSYAYTLAGNETNADDNLQVTIPVTITTPVNVTIPTAKNQPSTYLTQIKKMIGKWFAIENPVQTQAYFLFEFSVFSAQASDNIPILHLRDVRIGVDHIDLTDLKNWDS